MKTCPNCKEEVDDNFDTCWNCMYSFEKEMTLDIPDNTGKRKVKASGNINYDELRDEITRRLNNGESVESIKMDIKSRIPDYYDFLSRDVAGEENLDDDKFIQAASVILSMKDDPYTDDEIKEELKKIGVGEQTSENIIRRSRENEKALVEDISSRLRRRKSGDLLWGPIILFIGLLVTISTIAMDEGHYIIAYGAIIVGFGKTIRGLGTK